MISSGTRTRWCRGSGLAAVIAAALWLPPAALGQAPASKPEMCGDGTTFRVNLPGRPGSLPDGAAVAADYVELPGGCDIYAIFVSGYEVNRALNTLSFYKLAKFVAERNGYVHYSWWNNFMGEYLRGPLHGGNLPGDTLTPGLVTRHVLGFVPQDVLPGPVKAVPDEDHQFQDDARLVLEAIRARHPHALIIVAGHSMGGNAVARLGAATGTTIDLLAPIDPVGNRSTPVGIPGTDSYNWNRWRVVNNLQGYRRVDCVRNGLVCADFDPRLLYVSFRCQAVGPVLSQPPVVATLAPIACPRSPTNPYRVMGSRPHIGANVRMLYHRWQREFPFPFDVREDYVLSRGPLTPLLGGNYQAALLENAVGEGDRNKSCGEFGALNRALIIAQLALPGFALPFLPPQPIDPRDPNLVCSPIDGHGEIMGYRGVNLGGPIGHGTEAQNHWPCYQALESPTGCGADDSYQRRLRLVEMATAPSPNPDKTIVDANAWIHEPRNPNLDMVSNDLMVITQHLLDLQPAEGDDVPPSTAAATLPGANPAGWYAEDVEVSLTASDLGSGVLEIEHSTTGAQTGGPTVTSGAQAQELITVEGLSTVRFFARDNDGNVEAPQEIVVRLDRTPPEISAETSTAANDAGWFNRAVMVSFPAFDVMSGLASSTPEQMVAAEGREQEIVGTAEDLAGNLASAAAILNIDLTPPGIALHSPGDGAVVLLNGALTGSYTCTDALSGIVSCEGTEPDGASIDTTVPGDRSFAVAASDVAGNVSSTTHAYAVRYGFSGFLPPPGGGRNAGMPQAGGMLQVAWALHDARGIPIGDLGTFVGLASAPAACDGSGAGAAEPASTVGRSPVSYIPGLRRFVFRWETDASWAGTCRQLQLQLADGATRTTLIRFR